MSNDVAVAEFADDVIRLFFSLPFPTGSHNWGRITNVDVRECLECEDMSDLPKLIQVYYGGEGELEGLAFLYSPVVANFFGTPSHFQSLMLIFC